MAFLPLGNSNRVGVSVSIDFPIKLKQDALFHCLCDHLRDVVFGNTSKLSASVAASQFCK